MTFLDRIARHFRLALFVRFVLVAVGLFGFAALAQDATATAPPWQTTPAAAVGGSTLAGTLLEWLVVIICGLFSAIGTLITHALASRASQSRLAALGQQLWAVVTTVASHAEAELRPTIDKDLEDGKLDPDEAKALKAQAMLVLRNAAPDLIKEIAKRMKLSGDGVTTYLSGLLEQAVAKLPDSPPATPQAAPTPPVAAPPPPAAASPK